MQRTRVYNSWSSCEFFRVLQASIKGIDHEALLSLVPAKMPIPL